MLCIVYLLYYVNKHQEKKINIIISDCSIQRYNNNNNNIFGLNTSI